MNSGLTYVDAGACYDTMVSVFQDAVVEGHRVKLGKLGVLEPHILPPRTVKMGFVRERDEQTKKLSVVKRVTTEYTIGARLKYKLKLNRSFLEKHQLRWFAVIWTVLMLCQLIPATA